MSEGVAREILSESESVTILSLCARDKRSDSLPADLDLALDDSFRSLLTLLLEDDLDLDIP